jgi:hypothetical protein
VTRVVKLRWSVVPPASDEEQHLPAYLREVLDCFDGLGGSGVGKEGMAS